MAVECYLKELRNSRIENTVTDFFVVFFKFLC